MFSKHHIRETPLKTALKKPVKVTVKTMIGFLQCTVYQ